MVVEEEEVVEEGDREEEDANRSARERQSAHAHAHTPTLDDRLVCRVESSVPVTSDHFAIYYIYRL